MDAESGKGELAERAAHALRMVEQRIEGLTSIIGALGSDGVELTRTRLARWREVTARLILEVVSKAEASKFWECDKGYRDHDDLERDIVSDVNEYAAHLEGLKGAITERPDFYLAGPEKEVGSGRKEDETFGMARMEAVGAVVPASAADSPAYPDRVTWNWLRQHVPITWWFWAAGILGSAFFGGVQAGRFALVRDLMWSEAAIRSVVPEESREARLYRDRKELVKSWRAMITELLARFPEGKPLSNQDVAAAVARHPGYLTLRPLLSQQEQSQMFQVRVFVYGALIPTDLGVIQGAVDRIEREWGLLPK